MGDTLLQIGLPPLALLAIFISVKSTQEWINPITIIVPTFFVPMYLATFRLAGVQNATWDYETYVSLWLTITVWIIVPALIFTARGRAVKGLPSIPLMEGKSFLVVYRSFAAFVCATYLASNYIQAGTILPILVPEIAYHLHADFVPGLRLFARCISAVTGLAYLAFAHHRKPVDIVILITAIIIPLTRLSRIDFALSIVILLCLFSAKPIFKISWKKIGLIILMGAAIAVGNVELGNQRTNRFGTYEVKYEEAIKWRPSWSGPAGIFAVLYGYFPLSFDNFDSYVHENKNNRTYGLLSFDWFFSGTIKANRLAGGLMRDTGATGRFQPVSSAANVPTALQPFYGDYGMWGMIFPAAPYMLLWIFLFYQKHRSYAHLISYAIYSAAFSLSAFQALMTASFVFHEIVLSVFVCVFSLLTERAYRKRHPYKSLRTSSIVLTQQRPLQ